LGRAGDYAIAEWVGVATLRAHISGSESEFAVADGVEPSQRVRQRLRVHVDALLRHLRGEITLHASSVARDDAAIAFVGDSGAGKSTVAAQLCLDPDVALLSDDAAALRFGNAVVLVVPTESTHWLRPDVAELLGFETHGEAKIPREAKHSATASVPLRAVVSLTFDESARSASLRPIGGAEAFSILSLSTFRFALDVPEVLCSELDRLATLVEEVQIFELRRPQSHPYLAVSQRIVAELLLRVSNEGKSP
jgi:hypothetical protein